MESRLKPVRLGKATIEFRQTAPEKLYWAGRPAMKLVQAMLWLRDVRDENEITSDLKTAMSRMNSGDVKADLKIGLSMLPAWLQELVRELD